MTRRPTGTRGLGDPRAGGQRSEERRVRDLQPEGASEDAGRAARPWAADAWRSSTCISPGARAERVVRSQVPTCASPTRRFRPLAYVFLFHIVRCVFLSSSFAESLCFLDTSLLRPLISKYFLLVYGLHFILVTILQNTRFLVLMRSNFVFFSSINHTFGVLEPRIHSHKVFLRPV